MRKPYLRFMSGEETWLVTGGAGFIGSHLVRRLVQNHPTVRIVVLDALTYAGNLANLNDLRNAINFRFEQTDLTDAPAVADCFARNRPTAVLHLAAESHVDRSITAPLRFVQTNVLGTAHLLEAALRHWQPQGFDGRRFLHVSTDEVFGSLGAMGKFSETTPYDPRSPYSASKAASDHLVRAYAHTYGLPVLITNCSNNYGPYQFPEKLIPLVILNLIEEKSIPVYGKGENVRDWLWVEEHVEALELVLLTGQPGETYAIGGNNEQRNLDVVRHLSRLSDELLGRKPGRGERLIQFVTDRPGHDHRYAIDAHKMEQELGWAPRMPFEQGLRTTFEWYLANTQWVTDIRSGAYRSFLPAS